VALEADHTTLGTAYHYWLVIVAHLQRHISSETTSAELRKHVTRWTDYYWEQLPHDLMATVLLLHPHLRDAVPLTTKAKDNACMFVCDYILQTRRDSPGRGEIARDAAITMFAYISRSGQFAKLPGPEQGQNDAEWWRRWFADGDPVNEAMVEMAERLLSIPPHTAVVERFYSRLGFMQSPRRSNLSVEMLVDMAMVNAWLVATDPWFGKPPRAASGRIAAHASGDEQGRTTIDSDEDDGGDDEDDDSVVSCDEDSPADSDDDAAATATSSNNESLLHAEGAGVAPASVNHLSRNRPIGRCSNGRKSAQMVVQYWGKA
jgi:hypothetical protein